MEELDRSLVTKDPEALQALPPDDVARRMILLATLALWSANFFIFTMISVLKHPANWAATLGPRLLLVLLGAGLCYLLHRLLQWAAHWGFRRQLVAAAIATPLAAEAYGWCNFLVGTAIYGPGPDMPLSETIFQLSLHFWFFASWIGFYLAISYNLRLRQQEKREALARFHAQAAQLQALHYQINPHFLFNTLNSVSSLIVDQRNAEAETMVHRLSEFMRLTLDLDPKEDVPLAAELRLQRAYLDIEQVRFPDMKLTIEVAEDLRAAAIPGLILQPLVENAVKHGVASNTGPSHISISATRADQQIAVEIANRTTLAGPRPGSGIGLRNVRERLAARFGDAASLDAGISRAGEYRAKLLMPLVACP